MGRYQAIQKLEEALKQASSFVFDVSTNYQGNNGIDKDNDCYYCHDTERALSLKDLHELRYCLKALHWDGVDYAQLRKEYPIIGLDMGFLLMDTYILNYK